MINFQPDTIRMIMPWVADMLYFPVSLCGTAYEAISLFGGPQLCKICVYVFLLSLFGISGSRAREVFRNIAGGGGSTLKKISRFDLAGSHFGGLPQTALFNKNNLPSSIVKWFRIKRCAKLLQSI